MLLLLEYLPSNTTIHLIAQELATSDYAKVDLRRTLAATFLHYGVTKNLAHRASFVTVVMPHRNCTTALMNGEQPFVWKRCYCYYHGHLNMIRDEATMRGCRQFSMELIIIVSESECEPLTSNAFASRSNGGGVLNIRVVSCGSDKVRRPSLCG